ncbi:hypothetical protein BH10PSE9_BH10PSE9_07020 [soil metagenome]
MHLVRRLPLALAGVAGFLLTAQAFADEPVETAIKSWVASIDASPDWAATYAGLTYDAAAKKAVLTGLTIHTEQPGLVANFTTISVTNFAQAPNGGFSAARIAADRASITAGPLAATISDVELNEFALPAVGPIAWDPQHLFTSLIKAYAPVTQVRITNGRVGAFDLAQDTKGVKSKISYGQFRIDRWADGKIAGVTAGPLSMEAPSPDGLMRMKVASVEGRDIDLNGFLHVYDPSRYVGGVGDMVWKPVMRLVAYRDFSIDGPGLRFSMGLVSLENFKLRQPKKSFADFLDRILANPTEQPDSEESARTALSMLSAYGFGRFGISNVDVRATGIDRLRFAGFSMTDFSSDGLGELAIDGFDGFVRDQGAVKIGRFAFGGLVFPSLDRITQAMQADMAGKEPDVMGLIPKLGFIEAKAIDVTTPDVPRTTLERFRVDLGKYIGPVPTAVTADLSGLVLPVSLIEDADARATFKKLGYAKIDVSYGLKLNWNEPDQAVNLEDLRILLKGVGSLATSMTLVGLPRAAIENPKLLEQVLPTLKLRTAAFTFTDDSIVGKGLDMLAEKLKAPPARFRQQFADAIPFLLTLTALNDPKIMALVKQSGVLAKVTPALKAFIASPSSSITVKLTPTAPLSIPDIAATADKAPEKLVDLLGLSISSTGTLPAAAPAPQQPQQPTTTPGGSPPPTNGLRPTTP